MARRRARNVYFGKNSVFKAVKDIGRPGCKSAKEVKALAIAQFLDWLDGKTVDKKTGRVKRFTDRVWAGRLKILHILASKYGGKRAVQQIQKLKEAVEEGKISKRKARELALKLARKWGVRSLLRKLRI